MDAVPNDKDAVSVTRNRRTDAMFVAAYIAVVGLVYVVIYEDKVGQFAQGIVTLVLGMFLNELKNMYSYETGTTRASATKDAAIARIAEQSAPSTAAAVAATVAAEAAKSAAPPPIPVVPAVQPTEEKPI